MALIDHCVCGNTDYTPDELHSIPVNICNSCGVVHQRLDMTPEQYYDFYSTQYHTEFQENRGTQTYEQRSAHDKQVSELRLEQYRAFLTPDSKILDIGSSNNAFVDVMNDEGFKAYGVEIGSEGKNHPETTYNMLLEDVHFPPAYLDFITMHDVLEHLIDPFPCLDELHKILADDGTVIIDFPNFFEEAGFHHWKTIEHLWMPTDEQLRKWFDENNFLVHKVTKPIPSKVVYYLKKKPNTAKKVKLLFMPGMGDIYWGLTKVESFIEKNNLGVPEAYIWDVDQKQIKGNQRSEGYLSRMPFMEYKGTFDCRWNHELDKFYAHKKASHLPPVWHTKNPHGQFDYMFNMNGFLEIGEGIETGRGGLDDYETNWFPPMFTPIEEYAQQKKYEEEYGKYIFGYFTGTGSYDTEINRYLTPEVVYNIASEIYKANGTKLVITGTTWDKENSDKIKALDKEGIIIDLIGQTDTSQLYALMKGSVGVFGWPAGNTIIATYFKIPTIMVWSRKLWNEKFPINCIAPEAHNEWYFHFYSEQFNSQMQQQIVNTALNKFNYEK